jgi:2'-5' RNA ligase
LRLFVAINLPETERGNVARALVGLGAEGLPVRWSAREALHLTLKFLGEVPDARAGEIGAALAEAVRGARPFDVTLSGLGGFPELARASVVWLGVERHPALELLANDVELALAALGFESELRPFHPHVTLGRVRRGIPAGRLAGLAALGAAFDYQGAIQVERLDLMRSSPGKGGSVYTVVHSASLSGAASAGAASRSGNE